MSINEEVVKALRIAMSAHEGQTDLQGNSYIQHPMRVSQLVVDFFTNEPLYIKRAQVVAMLHDVIEDSDVSSDDLLRSGVSSTVVADVVRLTKVHSQMPAQYLDCIKQSRVATAVKFADLIDNTAPGRLVQLKSADKKRLQEKYRFYYTCLLGVDFCYNGAQPKDHPLVRMLGERLAR